MPKCKFDIKFESSAAQVIEHAEKAIIHAKGTFAGDIDKGNFEIATPLGDITGNYQMNGSTIIIEISHKPFLVSCKKIEETLRDYLAGDNH